MRTYKTVPCNGWRARVDGIGAFIRLRQRLHFHIIDTRNRSVLLPITPQSQRLETCYWSIRLLGALVRRDMQTYSTKSTSHRTFRGQSIRSWLRALQGVGKPPSNPASISERSINTICDLRTCGLVHLGCQIRGHIPDRCALGMGGWMEYIGYGSWNPTFLHHFRLIRPWNVSQQPWK